LAAARRTRLRLRSDVRARRRGGDFRRNRARAKTSDQPPRPRLRQARRGLLPGPRKVSAGTPLAVYIHWPFCRSKCPYCDFNSHVRDAVDATRWTWALIRDLERQAEFAAGRSVGSVFFGGGTPSLMPPETVAALLDAVRSHWAVTPDLGITLEANPNSAEADRFQEFAAAGVCRLSLVEQAVVMDAMRLLRRTVVLDVGTAG